MGRRIGAGPNRVEAFVDGWRVHLVGEDPELLRDDRVVHQIGYLGRRSDGPLLERFLGPLGTLFAEKFYFDQLYAALVVRPLEGLAFVAALFDRYVIDGAVDAIASAPGSLGSIIRRSQSGLMQRYALAGVMGVLTIVVVLAWQLRR